MPPTVNHVQRHADVTQLQSVRENSGMTTKLARMVMEHTPLQLPIGTAHWKSVALIRGDWRKVMCSCRTIRHFVRNMTEAFNLGGVRGGSWQICSAGHDNVPCHSTIFIRPLLARTLPTNYPLLLLVELGAEKLFPALETKRVRFFRRYRATRFLSWTIPRNKICLLQL
jgi:hypothetical protein